MNAADLLPRLRAAGLIDGGDLRVRPLTGGVSSDIVLVESATRRLVVKAALAKLRVRDDWFADVSRNRVEQAYFEYAASIIPGAVPLILGGDSAEGWFAMEYLGDDLCSWKSALLAGHADLDAATAAGRTLGILHAASWADPVARDRFATLANFRALRIEPYLLTTAERVPAVAALLHAEALRLATTQLALVHGDFSPKNLLASPQQFIVLDAECAWFGDPAFDTAFLLTHLHLKALLHPQVIPLVPAFWSAYTAAMKEDIESRTVRLLLCLLLARVHGKSPVEYLSDPQRDFVTRFTLTHLPHPPSTLAALTAAWTASS